MENETEQRPCDFCGNVHQGSIHFDDLGPLGQIIRRAVNNIEDAMERKQESHHARAEEAYARMKERGVLLSEGTFVEVDNAMALFTLRNQILHEAVGYLIPVIESAPIAAISFLNDIKTQARLVASSATSLQDSLIVTANKVREDNGEEPIQNSKILEYLPY